MKLDLDKTVLVTHRGCMDGGGCALVFLAAGGKKENIRYVKAGLLERFIKDEHELMESDRFLLIADLGLNDVSYMERLQKRGSFLFVDHHVTSLGLAGQANVVARGDACGSMLLAEVLEVGEWKTSCFPKVERVFQIEPWPLEQLLRYIDDFDRWILQHPESDDVAVLFNFYGQERFVQTLFERPNDEDGRQFLFTPEEDALIELLKLRRDESIEADLKRVRIRDTADGKVGYVVTGNPNISQLLQALLDRFPEVDVACQVNVEKDSASLRSRRDGPDVARLCSRFGGGGHVHAAGHRLPGELLDTVIDEVHGA